MADLTITVFAPIHDNAQVPPRLLSAPVAVDMSAATPVKYNVTTGKFEKMAATDAPDLFAGWLTKDTKAGYVGSAFRGLARIDGVTALDVGALLFISVTTGALADANPAANEVQTVTITGSPTGGTFDLTFGGQTASGIAHNAAASVVQAALEALSSIGVGNVVVSGSAGGPYTVTFINDLGKQPIAAMTKDATSLTGGTSPDVAVAEATPGMYGQATARIVPLHSAGNTFTKLVEIFDMPQAR